jgi:hypothetical protein
VPVDPCGSAVTDGPIVGQRLLTGFVLAVELSQVALVRTVSSAHALPRGRVAPSH